MTFSAHWMTWHRRRIRRAINRRRSSGAAVPLVARRPFDLAADLIAFFDRRRRIREYSAYGGTLCNTSAQDAFAAQLSELRGLPTIEPHRRLA
jgi:hypothetical protein